MARPCLARAMMALSLLVLLVAVPSGFAAAQEAGDDIYQSQCSGCHGIDGLGIPGAFPPLVDNPHIEDSGYVAEVIRQGLSGPIEVNGQTFDGQMPAFGGLSDEEVASLVAFVQDRFAAPSQPTGVPQATEPAAPPATEPEAEPAAFDAGAVERGENLFLGATGLVNGGMACMACHTAGSHGNLGGNGLGPDLTTVHSRLGGTPGLTAVLENPAFLVMRSAYADKPITAQERLDLAAFLETTVDQQADGTNWLVLFGLEGVAFLFLVLAIFFRSAKGSGYANKLRRST